MAYFRIFSIYKTHRTIKRTHYKVLSQQNSQIPLLRQANFINTIQTSSAKTERYSNVNVQCILKLTFSVHSPSTYPSNSSSVSELKSWASTASNMPGSISSLSESVSLLLSGSSVIIHAFLKARTTVVTDIAAQASTIHWQIVA